MQLRMDSENSAQEVEKVKLHLTQKKNTYHTKQLRRGGALFQTKISFDS